VQVKLLGCLGPIVGGDPVQIRRDSGVDSWIPGPVTIEAESNNDSCLLRSTSNEAKIIFFGTFSTFIYKYIAYTVWWLVSCLLVPGTAVTPRSQADLGAVLEEDWATRVTLQVTIYMRYI
jgi:hypothetical protein